MANARRVFTPAQKQEVVEYAEAHGTKAAMDKYKIGGWSQINRWRATPVVQRKKGAWREKKWTPEKVAGVLDYLKTHTHDETMKHFKISSSQISLWRRGLTYNSRKTNGAATNGLGALPEKDALKWLETWRAAYFDRMKAETPSASEVLAALRLSAQILRGGK